MMKNAILTVWLAGLTLSLYASEQQIAGAGPRHYRPVVEAGDLQSYLTKLAASPWTPDNIEKFSAIVVHQDQVSVKKSTSRPIHALNAAAPQVTASSCSVAATPHTGSGIVVQASTTYCAAGYKEYLDSDLQSLLCLKDECNSESPVPTLVESYYSLDSQNNPVTYPGLVGTTITGGMIHQGLFGNDGSWAECTNYFVKSQSDADTIQAIQAKLGAAMKYNDPAPDGKGGFLPFYQLQMCRTFRPPAP